jgi:hypothetical protein
LSRAGIAWPPCLLDSIAAVGSAAFALILSQAPGLRIRVEKLMHLQQLHEQL